MQETKGDRFEMNEGWEEMYTGRRILVLGLARSGIAALRLLRACGSAPIGADENAAITLPADLDGVPVHLGRFDPGLLDGCDEVVLSPGVALRHPFLVEAQERGISVISELELGYRFTRAGIIAVTGTNGKSTTVSMAGAILEAAGYRAIVAGNVGLPLTSVAGELDEEGYFVLEVSSFQLEAISSFHPRVAVLLNMTPDHLDRYESVRDYYDAKVRIVRNCTADDLFVYNAADPRCAAVAETFPGRSVPFSSRAPVEEGAYLDGDQLVRRSGGSVEVVVARDELGVVGLHNIENALAAVAAVRCVDVPAESCRAALSGFRGLPHRMEPVETIDGITYYNDSKATNVEATVMSLKGLKRPVVLIAGGYDKGGDFTKLLSVIDRIKAVVTIGEAGSLIEEAVASRVPVARAASMQEAVEIAGRTAEHGQLVILSPACASFDMFENYEHRGDVFKTCVKGLVKSSR
ncbi:MAG: UDP-N-acetylmuramoyl-L-alanine--D-glutamate ligase [bacterium]|nr:MAG: UDP-N-acetylmuramoyl-L-alanine--D-glutamate ligase [bacterium]